MYMRMLLVKMMCNEKQHVWQAHLFHIFEYNPYYNTVDQA